MLSQVRGNLYNFRKTFFLVPSPTNKLGGHPMSAVHNLVHQNLIHLASTTRRPAISWWQETNI